jgi:hypothetical protein
VIKAIWELIKASISLGVEVTETAVILYGKALGRFAKWSIILALVLIPLPIIGTALHISWMNGMYVVIISLLCFLGLVVAFPIVMLTQLAFEKVTPIRKTALFLVGVLFWFLIVAVYFYLVPVWNSPAFIPLIFILFVIFSLGWIGFRIRINPKLVYGLVFIIFILMTVSFFVPKTRMALGTLLEIIDRNLSEIITSPSRPSQKPLLVPSRVEINSIEKLKNLHFFDPITGESKIWYSKGTNGRFELFDASGFHPQSREKLKPVTTKDEVAQIVKYFEAELTEGRPKPEINRRLLEFNSLVNRKVTTYPNKPNVAIVIESRKTESGVSPESTLYDLLRTDKVNMILNLFKEELFKSKDFFREIYDGNTELLKEADAMSKIDYLILGKLNYSLQKGSGIDRDLISCNINFSYKIINKNAEVIRSDNISVIGPGFSEDAALQRGLEMLSEKYSNRIFKTIL